MRGRILMSAALIGALAIGTPMAASLAQTKPAASSQQMTKKPAKKVAKKAAPAAAPAAKMTTADRRLDNVADKLNACQLKPEGERQACIGQATKM